jgi:hypothetical protein
LNCGPDARSKQAFTNAHSAGRAVVPTCVAVGPAGQLAAECEVYQHMTRLGNEIVYNTSICSWVANT